MTVEPLCGKSILVDKGDAFRKQRELEDGNGQMQRISKIRFPAIISESAAAVNRLCHIRGDVLDVFL